MYSRATVKKKKKNSFYSLIATRRQLQNKVDLFKWPTSHHRWLTVGFSADRVSAAWCVITYCSQSNDQVLVKYYQINRWKLKAYLPFQEQITWSIYQQHKNTRAIVSPHQQLR